MKKIRLDKNLVKVVSAAIILTLAYFLFYEKLPALNNLSLKTSDLFANLAYDIKARPKSIKDICVIVIDDESFVKLQKKWPWPRSTTALFLERLNEYKPKIVSLDLSYIGESPDKNDDVLLAQAIRNADNVILSGYISPDGSYNKPYLPLRNASLDVGFVNKPRDKDLIVRNSRLLYPKKKGSEQFDLSFGLKSALHFLDITANDIRLKRNHLFISQLRNIQKPRQLAIPLSRSGTARLNFQAKQKDFEVISFYKIINKIAPEKSIAGKLVVVGVTAEIFHDIYGTPLGLMPGVILNSNEILMYLSGQTIKDLPKIWQLALILLAAILSAVLTYKLKILKGFFSLIGLLAVLFLISLIFTYSDFAADYFGALFIACFVYLGTESFKYVRLLVEATVLKTMAITDGLTGLYVHRYLMLKLEAEFNRASEENTQLSFLIMDIDHFKNINDTYGHEEGNVILKNIAKILQDLSRRVDIVARYGGEEFCAILPSTSEKGANIYAERIRKTIEEFDFPYKENQPIKATISIGIASLKIANPQTAQELIAFADKALYEAKETGRNKVCNFIPPQAPEQNKIPA